MAGRNDPSALRWLIGVELAAYRKQAGLTLAELPTATGISKPEIGHMESGRYRQQPDDPSDALRECGADQRGIDRLTSLSGRSDSKAWWVPWAHVVPDWFTAFVGLEGLSESEFVYEPPVLPGLMPTEDYAQAVTGATGFVRRNHTERFVSFRLARARRLEQEDPLRFHAVVGDAAPRLAVASPEVRFAQYERLIELADRPHVTLHRSSSPTRFAAFTADYGSWILRRQRSHW